MSTVREIANRAGYHEAGTRDVLRKAVRRFHMRRHLKLIKMGEHRIKRVLVYYMVT